MAKWRVGLSLIWLKKFEKPPEADKTGEFGVVGIQDLFEGKNAIRADNLPGTRAFEKKMVLSGRTGN